MSVGDRSIVRTVLGDVDPGTLGATDYHEHLFQASAQLAGDELDNEELSQREAADLAAHGIGAMIEATPMGLGRNDEGAARISAATGLAVVHVTGAHHAEHYREGHPLLTASEESLTSFFLNDVVDGFKRRDGKRSQSPGGEPVRAGMIKAGIRYWAIGDFERRVLAAAARTHVATGAPVMVHTTHGSATHEVLELLEADGVPRESVVLAHMDRNLDVGLWAELTASGAYIGCDGMARHREAPDSAIIAAVSGLIEAGGGERILLGGDVGRASRYLAYGGMPGLAYLPQRFVPRLRAAVGDEAVRAIQVDNPARLLAFAPHV